ncbi:porin (plasmid) [Pantoea ananatis]|nr:hypothetical protein [Pantoea ananatis]USL60501.1 porin [Pantoea ananatis]
MVFILKRNSQVKKVVLAGVAMVLAGMMQNASALQGGMSFGKDYTSLNLGVGADSPGFALSGGWLRSERDGKVGNLGLNYGIGGDNWMISPGVKVMRNVPKDGAAGYSGAVGGDIRFYPSAKIGLFGSYYWSPDAWSEHSDGIRQADAGISFRPVSLLDVTLGYRYVAIEGKNGAKDNVIADGIFVGGGVHF